MKLPQKIELCPIIEAVVEIRFEASIFRNAVFGIVYNSLKDQFSGEVEKLPILQIPENLLQSDPSFQYKPYYKITKGNYALQIGPDVISISCLNPYSGWKEYSQLIFQILENFSKLNIIKKVERLG